MSRTEDSRRDGGKRAFPGDTVIGMTANDIYGIVILVHSRLTGKAGWRPRSGHLSQPGQSILRRAFFRKDLLGKALAGESRIGQ